MRSAPSLHLLEWQREKPKRVSENPFTNQFVEPQEIREFDLAFARWA